MLYFLKNPAMCLGVITVNGVNSNILQEFHNSRFC